MQIDQIIVRPAADLILLQHTDSAARSGSTVILPASLDAKQAEALSTFLALSRDLLLHFCSRRVVRLGREAVAVRPHFPSFPISGTPVTAFPAPPCASAAGMPRPTPSGRRHRAPDQPPPHSL